MTWVYVGLLVLCIILTIIECFVGVEMPERDDGKEM